MRRFFSSILLFVAAHVIAEFPGLPSGGTFQEQATALGNLQPLPDNRRFDIVTIEGLRQLGVEELTAAQGARSGTWFSSGTFLLRPSLESLAAYVENDHATMKGFFDGIAAASEQMSAEEYVIEGKVVERTAAQGRRHLLINALDSVFYERVTASGGQYLALIAPADPAQVAAAQDGGRVALNVSLYRLLDAYGGVLPRRQRDGKVTVRTFVVNDSTYAAQQAQAVAVNGSVVQYTWRPAQVTVIAGWALGVEYNTRAKGFSLVLGAFHTTAALPLDGNLGPSPSAEYSLLTDEERFPELIAQRAEMKQAQADAKAQEEAEKRQVREEQWRGARATREAERERVLEANKPRAEFWRLTGLIVYAVSLLPLLVFLYGRIKLLHPKWKIVPEDTWGVVKPVVGAIWLGGFLGAACMIFGALPILESIIPALFVSGIGGVVAILCSSRYRSAFRRTREDRIRDSVAEGVQLAIGYTWFYLIVRPIMQYILIPLLVGSLLIPLLWVGVLKVAYNELRRDFRNKVMGDGNPSDEMPGSPAAE